MTAFVNLLSAIALGAVDLQLQEFDFKTSAQNQMLFFIKPEVFLLDPEDAENVCRLIWDRLSGFGVEVAGAYLMSAETLEAAHIMDRHYGYINQVSRTASTSLSETDQSKLREMCGATENTPIIGGHEILIQNPIYSAKSLDTLWATKKSKRLRSGLYVETFDIDGVQTVITNGFHPYQLEHFTGKGRKICLLLLNSDLPWGMLRGQMLGDTFPEKAVSGSIRGDLNRNAAKFGFNDVTIANNCAHMSAGAFEAAFELNNFLSGTETGFSLQQSRLAAHFRSFALSSQDVEQSLANPAPHSDIVKSSLFDATEECDSLAAVATFKQFYRNAGLSE